MKNVASSAWSSLVYWKVSIIRCLIYATMVTWAVFKAGTQGYDHWSDLSSMQKVWLCGDMWVAFAGVVVAFLDNSLQRLQPAASGSTAVVAKAEVTSTVVDPTKDA